MTAPHPIIRAIRANAFEYAKTALFFIVAYLAVWALLLIGVSTMVGPPGEGAIRPGDFLVGAAAVLAPFVGVLAGRVALDETLRTWNGWAAFAPLILLCLADLVVGLGDALTPGAQIWPTLFWGGGLLVALASGYWFLVRARA